MRGGGKKTSDKKKLQKEKQVSEHCIDKTEDFAMTLTSLEESSSERSL